MKKRIRIAIVGVGNCASSLVQGIHFYRIHKKREPVGLMHADIGGFGPGDIEVTAAIDIDKRKVGKDLGDAIFSFPNCTTRFCTRVPNLGVKVFMGKILDGIAPHMKNFTEQYRFVPVAEKEATAADIVELLKKSGAEILMNYLPVGSEKAANFYARCALDAGLGFINNMPVFIASQPEWAKKFSAAGLPVVGDDIKSQLGATITHRVLARLFRDRGVKLLKTYQLNTGGNTDFLNMLDQSRLKSKRISKTDAVQSMLDQRLADQDIHIGPSDYISWLNDNKVCFLRMEGLLFGEVPMNLEMRLSVEDSPNSAGVGIDAIRCCRLALDRGRGGVLYSASAYFMKHPPIQYPDDEACRMVEEFIRGTRED